MIFVDSNIPMYVIGGAHPNKDRARLLLERCVIEGDRLVTSAEVFQEILHRYVAIGRREAVGPAFQLLNGVVDEVMAVEHAHVERARELVTGSETRTARDALHAAVMEAAGIQRILTFDRDFDRFSGLERVS